MLGDAHPDTLIALSSLVTLLRDKGELAAAEQLQRLRVRGALGDARPNTRKLVAQLAEMLNNCGGGGPR